MELCRHAWRSLEITDSSIPLLTLCAIGNSGVRIVKLELVALHFKLSFHASRHFQREEDLLGPQ
jgi:hypothetical protein